VYLEAWSYPTNYNLCYSFLNTWIISIVGGTFANFQPKPLGKLVGTLQLAVGDLLT